MRKIAESLGRFVTSVGASTDLQFSMVNIGSRTLPDALVARAAQMIGQFAVQAENGEIRSTIGEMTSVSLVVLTSKSLQYWSTNDMRERTGPSEKALSPVTRSVNKKADNSRFPHPSKRNSLYSASLKEAVSFSSQALTDLA